MGRRSNVAWPRVRGDGQTEEGGRWDGCGCGWGWDEMGKRVSSKERKCRVGCGGRKELTVKVQDRLQQEEEVCTVLVVPGSGPGCLRSKKHPWIHGTQAGEQLEWQVRPENLRLQAPVTAAGQVHSVCYWAIPWKGAVKLKPFTRAKEALKNSQDKKRDDTQQKRHRHTHQHQTSGHDFRKGGRISSNLIWWPHARHRPDKHKQPLKRIAGLNHAAS